MSEHFVQSSVCLYTHRSYLETAFSTSCVDSEVQATTIILWETGDMITVAVYSNSAEMMFSDGHCNLFSKKTKKGKSQLIFKGIVF